MSSSGTAHTAARNSSGRWVTAAPTSRPPLEPPWIASRSGVVYPSRISYSAAAVEVVEDVLLPLQHPGLVPRLAVLAAAAQVGHGSTARPLQRKCAARAKEGVRDTLNPP